MEVSKIQEGKVGEETASKTSFTQDEVNKIVATEVHKLQSKTVDIETFKSLQKENESFKQRYDELTKVQKQTALRNAFVNNGGVEERFDDFVKLNDNFKDIQEKDFDAVVKKVSQKQSYLFDFNDKKQEEPKKQGQDNKDKKVPNYFPY
jgi:uncharacterized membrane protein (DUF106 family)